MGHNGLFLQFTVMHLSVGYWVMLAKIIPFNVVAFNKNNLEWILKDIDYDPPLIYLSVTMKTISTIAKMRDRYQFLSEKWIAYQELLLM